MKRREKKKRKKTSATGDNQASIYVLSGGQFIYLESIYQHSQKTYAYRQSDIPLHNMHIRRERNASRTSRNYSPRGKRAVYVLRMGGIKVPGVDALIRGSGNGRQI